MLFRAERMKRNPTLIQSVEGNGKRSTEVEEGMCVNTMVFTRPIFLASGLAKRPPMAVRK